MLKKSVIQGLDRFKTAVLLYGVGFLLITLAETIATFKLQINLFILLLTLFGVIFVVWGGANGQFGLNALKKKSESFYLPAMLGPTGLTLAAIGIIFIAYAMPTTLFSNTVIPKAFPSTIYIPEPIQIGAGLYALFSASNISIISIGILVLASGALFCILATVIGLWRLGEEYKNRNLKLCSILFWLPTIGLLAFFIASLEINNIIKRNANNKT